MKKSLLVLFLVVLSFSFSAIAENDWAAYSLAELFNIQQEIINEIQSRIVVKEANAEYEDYFKPGLPVFPIDYSIPDGTIVFDKIPDEIINSQDTVQEYLFSHYIISGRYLGVDIKKGSMVDTPQGVLSFNPSPLVKSEINRAVPEKGTEATFIVTYMGHVMNNPYFQYGILMEWD